uniref:C2 domain-containing protein n=1 Tax=Oryza meridionalis TaxID=40149 RepID=A0A0E0FAB7_9ORYZ
MATTYLVVEVISADIPSSSNTSQANYSVEPRFNGQSKSTTIKENVAVWNERFSFDMRQREDPSGKPILEAAVYSFDQVSNSKSLLGKVLLPENNFHRHSANVDLMQYTLDNTAGVDAKLLLKLFFTGAVDKILLEIEDRRNHQTEGNVLKGIHDYIFESKDGYGEDNNVDQHGPAALHPADAVPTVIKPDFEEPGRLFERVQLLFVRVIKARKLPDMDANGSLDPYVEVQFGAYNKGVTRCLRRNKNPEWNETFAFSFQSDKTPSPSVDVVVNDKDIVRDDFVGKLHFNVKDIPERSPDDIPLEPTWYPLLDQGRKKLAQAKLLLAIWIGSQADEAYSHVWVPGYSPKVYENPKLWCLRVTIVEAQCVTDDNDLLRCKVCLGKQNKRTKLVKKQMTISADSTSTWTWMESFVFVAAEPFYEGDLELYVMINAPRDDVVIGQLTVPLSSIVRRGEDDHSDTMPGQWFDLKSPATVQLDGITDNGNDNSSMRIYLQNILEGGYHIASGSEGYKDDTRPADRKLWNLPIGRVQLGILRATDLPRRMDGSSVNPYCIAKYGDKWVRTRTVIDGTGLHVFNERRTWSVYDIATVLTVGVFDHCPEKENIDGSTNTAHHEIGKVRIHLSCLEADRIYAHSYPLIIVNASGIKKTGKLQLAVQFSSESYIDMLRMYARPTLPKMHYMHPLEIVDHDWLRLAATNVLALRLGRAEPPLRSEVVKYMCNALVYSCWSMRKSKANFARLMEMFIPLLDGLRAVRSWRNPGVTLLAHAIFVLALYFHELLPAMVLLCVGFKGLWNYRFRPSQPPYVDYTVSLLDGVYPDDLDEEFDTFPTRANQKLVKMRYERLRDLAGRVQTVLGDLASLGEKIQSLVNWTDPRATAVFLLFTVVAATAVYLVPTKILVGTAGFYIMRHPRLRRKDNTPSIVMSFISRLSSRQDTVL